MKSIFEQTNLLHLFVPSPAPCRRIASLSVDRLLSNDSTLTIAMPVTLPPKKWIKAIAYEEIHSSANGFYRESHRRKSGGTNFVPPLDFRL
jgi:hypothetical protein